MSATQSHTVSRGAIYEGEIPEAPWVPQPAEQAGINRGLGHARYFPRLENFGTTAFTKTASLNAAIQLGRTLATSLTLAAQTAKTASASLNVAAQQVQQKTASLGAAIKAVRVSAVSVQLALATSSTANASISTAIKSVKTATAVLSAQIEAAGKINSLLSSAIQTGKSNSADLRTAVQLLQHAETALNVYVLTSGGVSSTFSIAISKLSSAIAGLTTAIQEQRLAQASLALVVSRNRVANASSNAAVSLRRSATAILKLYVDAGGALPEYIRFKPALKPFKARAISNKLLQHGVPTVESIIFKSPLDDRPYYELNCVDNLTVGETVSNSATVTVSPATTPPLLVTEIVPTNQTYTFRLAGGRIRHGQKHMDYKLSITGATNKASAITHTFVVRVRP